MVQKIDTLIDKSDNFEIVRDQIALILATESVNQFDKATAAGKPKPEDWVFDTYIERARPWEALENYSDDEGEIKNETPLVNVWFDGGTFPKSKSDTVERQLFDVSYNIDCYAAAISVDNIAGGYDTGDELAALNLQRLIRLVRNILMAGVNTYLQFRALVWNRYINSITQYQPQQNNQNAQNVIAARIVLNVKFNEFSPQVTPTELEKVFVSISKDEDGKVVAELDIDTT